MAHTLSKQVTWCVIALLCTTPRPQLAWRLRARTRPPRMWKKPAAKVLGGERSHKTATVSEELRAPAAKIGASCTTTAASFQGRQCRCPLITLIPSGNCWQGGRRPHGERLQWADGSRWYLRCRCITPTQIMTIRLKKKQRKQNKKLSVPQDFQLLCQWRAHTLLFNNKKYSNVFSECRSYDELRKAVY